MGQQKRDLLLANWGILGKLAKRLGVTHEMVRLVFWGRSRSRRIERELKRRGVWITDHEISVYQTKRTVNVKARRNLRSRKAA